VLQKTEANNRDNLLKITQKPGNKHHEPDQS